MVRWMNVACFFCTLCVCIALASLVQFCMGLYLTFLQNDVMTVNRLVKTERFDAYLSYVLLVFIVLGFISMMIAFVSIYGIAKRNRPLSTFVTAIWLFVLTFNLVMLTVSLLYYYFILSQLRLLLVRSLQESPVSTVRLLDVLQLKYACCGIDSKSDYTNLPLESRPESCCREPNCWNNDTRSNNTISTMHANGCYTLIKEHLTIELWVLIGVTAVCALLQVFALVLLCALNERYRKSDEVPKLVITQLTAGVPINSDNHVPSAPRMVQEPIEISQI